MRKDPTEFRERFQRWKKGEKVYEAGLPKYDDGKDVYTPKKAADWKNGDAAQIAEKTFTDQCSQFANQILNDAGYNISGNAWNPNQMSLLYSGYDTSTRPVAYDLQKVTDYNHAATDNFYKNFDSKTLDPEKLYRVNMFYNGSGFQEQAYNEARDGVAGSHTGVVVYDPNSKKWNVVHNIHGTVHVDPFTGIQNSKNKYGITAIYEPRANNIITNTIGKLVRLVGGSYDNGKSAIRFI